MLFQEDLKLETARTYLRPVVLTDADFILHLVNTPEWLENIGDRKVRNPEQAELFIQAWAIDRYQKLGYGPYLIELKDNQISIGICGLFKRSHLDYPDLGFALLPDYIGKGYGKETSIAVIRHANALGFDKLYAITNPTNEASQHLIETLGFKLTSEPSAKELVYEKKLSKSY